MRTISGGKAPSPFISSDKRSTRASSWRSASAVGAGSRSNSPNHPGADEINSSGLL